MVMARCGLLMLVLALNCWSEAAGQVTIWLEDFDGYPDGTVTADDNNVANPNPDWITGGCVACIDTADWWEIRSGTLEARDVNEVVFFQTEEIDISGFSNIGFSLDISESGDHEGPYFGLDACADQTNEDYVNVLYRIDGGEWNLVKNFLNWCGLYDSCSSHTLYGDDGINSGDCRDHDADWGSATVVQNGLFGSNIEVRLETINSSDTEFIRFDNLRIEGTILLPVALKSFKATARRNKVQLDWQTSSETNNDYFQVERTISYSQLTWEPLGTIPGAGISNDLLDYSYQDLNPYPGTAYYRLKQVDFDGRFAYSSIESVVMDLSKDPYPNPATDHLIIPLAEISHSPADIRLFDISAKEILVPQLQDRSKIKLDLRNLAEGTYILLVRGYPSANVSKHQILIIR